MITHLKAIHTGDERSVQRDSDVAMFPRTSTTSSMSVRSSRSSAGTYYAARAAGPVPPVPCQKELAI